MKKIQRVNLWTAKWMQNVVVIGKTWNNFIESSSLVLEKIYGLVKTRKGNKPLRVITSECGTGVENQSIIAGKCFFPGVL